MPAKVMATTVANAPKQIMWEVLADFPNIANYTDSVKSSASTSDQETGVGASRHCDLAPLGTAEETIVEFNPGENIVISLYDTKGLPVKNSETTFSLTEIDSNTTRLTMRANVQAKGGVFAGVLGKILERRLPNSAKRLLDDLAASAEKMSRATPNRS